MQAWWRAAARGRLPDGQGTLISSWSCLWRALCCAVPCHARRSQAQAPCMQQRRPHACFPRCAVLSTAPWQAALLPLLLPPALPHLG